MRTRSFATRIRLTASVGLAALAVAAFAVPAAASPPEVFEERPHIETVDFDNGVILFLNTTRDDYCTADMVTWEEDVLAWLAGGEIGPFPEQPAKEGLEPVRLSFNDVANGTIVHNLLGRNLPIELWSFDDGLFPGQIGVGPCTDSDEEGELVASGTSSWRYQDNDLEAPSGARTNAFHDTGEATLTSPDGQRWTYTFSFRRVVHADGTEVVWDDSARLVPRGR
jgi:hypothetical protein